MPIATQSLRNERQHTIDSCTKSHNADPVLALKARLPTGHPSWPTLRGTCPLLVLRSRINAGAPGGLARPIRVPQALTKRFRGTGSTARLLGRRNYRLSSRLAPEHIGRWIGRSTVAGRVAFNRVLSTRRNVGPQQASCDQPHPASPCENREKFVALARGSRGTARFLAERDGRIHFFFLSDCKKV